MPMVIFLTTLLLALSIAYFLLWIYYPMKARSQHGRSIIEADENLTIPTVGIAATFGTISVRYPNGAFEDIGRVERDGRYIDMMRRFSSPEEIRLVPLYASIQERWSDLLRKCSRTIRRSLGLSASDVKILSEMLDSLIHLYPPVREEKQKQKGTRNPVTISYPALPALYEHNILHAALCLRIRIRNERNLSLPSTLLAAYAGNARGLRNNTASGEGCEMEMKKLPKTDILHVEVTSKTIIISVGALKAAKGHSTQSAQSRAFWNLGCQSDGDSDGNLGRFERYPTSFLRLEYPAVFSRDMVVIFTGQRACIEAGGVQGIVSWVLHRNGVDTVKTLNWNPEFVAARGAAVLGTA